MTKEEQEEKIQKIIEKAKRILPDVDSREARFKESSRQFANPFDLLESDRIDLLEELIVASEKHGGDFKLLNRFARDNLDRMVIQMVSAYLEPLIEAYAKAKEPPKREETHEQVGYDS